MLRYKTITVVTSTTGEHLANALSGIGERKRIIRALKAESDRVIAAATALASPIRIRAYKDQDQVLDAYLGSFKAGLASATTIGVTEGLFQLDLLLEQGVGFQVGAQVDSTLDSMRITMIYEDQ